MPDKQSILDYIYSFESGGDYDKWVLSYKGDETRPLTSLSVLEVLEAQKRSINMGGDSAAGAGQIVHDTLAELVRKGVVNSDETFDKALQDRLHGHLLDRRGFEAWSSGNLTTQEFGNRIAKEWAAMPVLSDTYRGNKPVPRGSSYYKGVATNDSLTSADAFENFLTEGSLEGLLTNIQDVSYRRSSYDFGGVKQKPNEGFWLDDQNGPIRQPDIVPDGPWRSKNPTLDPARSGGVDGSGDSGYTAQPFDVDYNTRTGEGGGPMIHPDDARPHWTGWGRTAFKDEWTDSLIVRGVKDMMAPRFETDPNFDVVDAIENDGLGQFGKYLALSTNQAMYDYRKEQVMQEIERDRRRQVSNSGFSEFMGALTNPDSLALMTVPLGVVVSAGRVGASAVRSSVRGALYTGGAEAAIEAGRSSYDLTPNPAESIFRVAGASVGGAVFGGAFGAMAGRKVRKGLMDDIAEEVQAAQGRSVVRDIDGHKVTTEMLPEGLGRSLQRVNGVIVLNGKVYVNEAAVAARMERGDIPEGVETAADLVNYESVRQLAMAQSGVKTVPMSGEVQAGWKEAATPLASLGKDGKIRINKKEIERRIEAGEPLDLGKIKNGKLDLGEVLVDPKSFKNADDAKAFVRAVIDDMPKARSKDEFKSMVQGRVSQYGAKFDEGYTAKEQKAIRDAEEKAVKHVEKQRQERNKILEDKKLEAFGRIIDSPFKYIHRNALSSEARDLVNDLVYDGGFALGSNSLGTTRGPSVYSRAKTWDGVVDRIIRKEDEIFERYLGYDSNPTVAGVSINKSFARKRADRTRALTIEEFRAAVSKSIMTGVAHSTPEVNEMAAQIRAAFDEFKIPAETYGVLASRKNMETMEKQLRYEAKTAKGERLEVLNKQLDEIQEQKQMADPEPNEDYFTRVYSRATIQKHRDVFKERIVKPWMVQQPYIDVWELGVSDIRKVLKDLDRQFKRAKTDEQAAKIGARMDELEKRIQKAPKESKWVRKKADMRPAAIEKRADDMLATILEEADASDLSMLRQAHRPAFGRSRQFNIPNSFLIKDGPNGNGVADFIETDYVMTMKLYADRMGPAIEMSRTFARPADGINWEKGYYQRLEEVKDAERQKFKGSEEKFEEYWQPFQEKFEHLKDRVTNRVIKDPTRMDNRMASVLRDWANVTFMGMSALPASIEVGKLVMEHGMTKVFGHAFRQTDSIMDEAAKAGVLEGQKAGAIMDIHMGTALAGFAETGFDASQTSGFEKGLRTFANRFFMYNGLSPMVKMLKEVDLALRVPDMVQKIVRVGDGVASDADIAELDRLGISIAAAKRMYKEPIYDEDDVWFANTDAWGDEELVRTFRSAVRQGNENTILVATAADKPVIMDGTVYLRLGPRGAKKAEEMGLEKVGGAYKIQSGLATLPFAFWNYAVAATNKIMLAGLDEPTSRKMSGIAAMMGMAYLVSGVKTDREAWSNMSFSDRLTKTIDQSGIMGVLPNYINYMQGTAIGLTGTNPFPFDPRNGYMPSATDAMLNLAGAGPSVAANLVEGVATGDANSLSWAMPFRNHILLKSGFDALVDGIERRYAGG